MPLKKAGTSGVSKELHLEQLKAIHEQTDILREQTRLLREIHSMLSEQIQFLRGPTLGNR